MTRGFYARVAWALLGVGVVGFVPTYWVPLFRGTLEVQPLTHLHALLFYGWLVLLCWQATLVATGRTARHREFGVAGVSIATAMCFVGVAMALQSVRLGEAAGFGQASRAFATVPLLGILLFAALIAIAIANVKRPEIHKRFMVVATVSILQASLGRVFLLVLAPPHPPGAGPRPPPPIFVPLMPGAVVLLIIGALMLYDRRSRGRVHPAYWAAGAMVLFVEMVRTPFSGTAAWGATLDWLLAFVP
jgi:hypothetical protein